MDFDRIFSKTDTYDPSTKLPLYLLDTTVLPSPQSCNFEHVIRSLVDKVPSSNYAMVFFTAGLSADSGSNFSLSSLKNIKNASKMNTMGSVGSSGSAASITWGVKAFSVIPKQKRKFLRKIYIVHESWWIRALTEVLKNLVNSNFLSPGAGKVVHVASLSELSKHIDITKLNISLKNYEYEFSKLSDGGQNENLKIVIPIHLPDIFGVSLRNQPTWYYYNLLFYKLCQLYYLNKSTNQKSTTLALFGNNTSTILFKTKVLQDVISRNQLVTLDEFELPTILNLWKHFLRSLSGNDALFPLSVIRGSKSLLMDDIEIAVSKGLQKNGYHEPLSNFMNFILIPMLLHDVNNLYTSRSKGDANDMVEKYISKLCKSLSSFVFGNLSNHTEEDRQLGVKFLEVFIKGWPYMSSNFNKVPKICGPQPPVSRKLRDSDLLTSLVVTPNSFTSTSDLVKCFANYVSQTDLISKNVQFLNDKDAIFDKLGDATNLNNFNVVCRSRNSSPELNIDFFESSETKENEKPDSFNEKMKTNFKQFSSHFKPLTDSNSSQMSNLSKQISSLSLLPEEPVLTSSIPPKQIPKLPPRSTSKASSSSAEQLKKHSMAPPPPPPRSASPNRSPSRGLVSQSSMESFNSLGSRPSMSSLSYEMNSTSTAPPSSVNHKSSMASIGSVYKPARPQEFIVANKKKYAGIENGKVNKLAQLFEERVETIELLSTIQI